MSLEVGALWFPALAFGIYAYRLLGRRKEVEPELSIDSRAKIEGRVYVIIPARNEEKNLPHLLASLQECASPNVEVIVVDDLSTDKTYEVAQSFGVRVIQVKDKPPSWAGKTWACQVGVESIRGSVNLDQDWILFTDADCRFQPDTLAKAVAYSRSHQTDLLTAIPVHLSVTFWERLIPTFYQLVYLATNAFQEPQSKRLFAIGQFLLFRSKVYFTIGEHAVVKQELAEDLAFAHLLLSDAKRVAVYPKPGLYQVRMYQTFSEFMKGWTRIMGWGLTRSSGQTILEVFIVIGALLSAWSIHWSLYSLWIPVTYFAGRDTGEFSKLGFIFYPIGVLLFVVISIMAFCRKTFRIKQSWKERIYEANQC